MSQQHPNASVLEKIYAHFAKSELPAILDLCADNMTFNVAGKSKLAGKYTKENVIPDFFAKLVVLSKGSLELEAHDILASDRHGIVLCTDTVTKNGDKVQLRTVHVWRFENGKPVAWYEYPRDMYQYDAVWS